MLQNLTPHFNWTAYIKYLELPSQKLFNVTQPEFYKTLDQQLASLGLEEVKEYLRWHVAHANAQFLTDDFVNEDFDFYGRALHGTQQLRASLAAVRILSR